MINSLWLKAVLYFKGIRFYKTEAVPTTAEFQRAIFKTVNGHDITFSFYKETCTDLFFKRGKIYSKTFTGFIIQAKFDENMPADVYKYNNLKFFFAGHDIAGVEDKAISNMLLHIYLDFIAEEMRETSKLL